MPPKPNPLNQGTKKQIFRIFKVNTNSVPRSPSSYATPGLSDTSNAQSAIRNARLAIDGLKTASDMYDILIPLKLVSFALTLIVDTVEVGLQYVSKILLTSMECVGCRNE
jgi:hypothetical protein